MTKHGNDIRMRAGMHVLSGGTLIHATTPEEAIAGVLMIIDAEVKNNEFRTRKARAMRDAGKPWNVIKSNYDVSRAQFDAVEAKIDALRDLKRKLAAVLVVPKEESVSVETEESAA